MTYEQIKKMIEERFGCVKVAQSDQHPMPRYTAGTAKRF